jgi:hypothetical protein
MFRLITEIISILLLGCISASSYTKNQNGTISTNGSASDVQAAISAASAGTPAPNPAKLFWITLASVSSERVA